MEEEKARVLYSTNIRRFRKDISIQEIFNAGLLTHSALRIDKLRWLAKTIQDDTPVDTSEDFMQIWPETFYQDTAHV